MPWQCDRAIQRDVGETALNPTAVRAIQANYLREAVLRMTSIGTKTAHRPPETHGDLAHTGIVALRCSGEAGRGTIRKAYCVRGLGHSL
jgi:hypothetical protein